MWLFIAIELQKAALVHLERIQQQLALRASKSRVTGKNNLHITLAFLGEVPSSHVGNITSAMDEVPKGSFPVVLKDIGCFSKRYGDIWWVGVDGGDRLLTLQRTLCDALRKSGIWFDPKPFVPHLTIARDVVIPQIQDRQTLLNRTDTFTMSVGSISLMQSEHGNGKPIYTALHKKTLSS